MSVADVSVELLADHPQLIEPVGLLRWREWAVPPEPLEPGWWVDVTRRESGRDTPPITWVAFDEDGAVLGAVAIGEFDIEERRDRSPWILGMIVAEPQRRRGIGRLLLSQPARWAADHGYSQVWVATNDEAVKFYEACGWKFHEKVARNRGETSTVLVRPL